MGTYLGSCPLLHREALKKITVR